MMIMMMMMMMMMMMTVTPVSDYHGNCDYYHNSYLQYYGKLHHDHPLRCRRLQSDFDLETEIGETKDFVGEVCPDAAALGVSAVGIVVVVADVIIIAAADTAAVAADVAADHDQSDGFDVFSP